jgi:hypothetical protein
MKTSLHTILAIGAVVGTILISVPASANLMVNGNFEFSDNSYSTTFKPFGWTNVGHSEGVMAYGDSSNGPVPAYNGSYFYDLGGYGNPSGPVGHGIEQTVFTEIGKIYELVFGLSSENVGGNTKLSVTINDGVKTVNTDFTLEAMPYYGEGYPFGRDYPFGKGFHEERISFIANGALTTISFIETANFSDGNNDPLIDNVRLNPIPEPTTMLLFGMGIAGLAAVARRKSK